jgi:AraC-like DNA-binding protein
MLYICIAIKTQTLLNTIEKMNETVQLRLVFLSKSLDSLAQSEEISDQNQQVIARMKDVVEGLVGMNKQGGMKGQKAEDVSTFLTSPKTTANRNPRNEEFMKKLTELIHNNMTDEKLDIEFMTRHFNMSHSTFYRKVKEVTGVSAVDFIRRTKLKRGIELLKTHAYRISEVSYMTGFNSPAHFRQACKDEFHCTPSEILKD